MAYNSIIWKINDNFWGEKNHMTHFLIRSGKLQAGTRNTVYYCALLQVVKGVGSRGGIAEFNILKRNSTALTDPHPHRTVKCFTMASSSATHTTMDDGAAFQGGGHWGAIGGSVSRPKPH